MGIIKAEGLFAAARRVADEERERCPHGKLKKLIDYSKELAGPAKGSPIEGMTDEPGPDDDPPNTAA